MDQASIVEVHGEETSSLQPDVLIEINITDTDLKIGTVIGVGGEAVVYPYTYEGTKLALKIMWGKEFDAEHVKLLERLDHKNVIKLLGFCRIPFGLLMKRCKGNLDAQVICKESLSLDDFKKYAYQLADGMLYLHENRVTHRDLKPQNVLVTDKMNIKICDFEQSKKIAHTNALMTTAVYSFLWTAPEMLRGDAYTNTIDVWSYGVILWQLVMQRSPYEPVVKNFQPTQFVGPFLQGLSTGSIRLPVPQKLHHSIQSLIMNCLQVHSNDRPKFDTIVASLNEFKAIEISNWNQLKSTWKTMEVDYTFNSDEPNLEPPSSGREEFSFLTKYLDRRGSDLKKYHPQWKLSNEEIEKSTDLLKRDLTPICIPPSWDLVQKYSGALDKNADGFDEQLYHTGERLYAGDQCDAKFLDLMRNLPIGGVLFGNVNWQHMIHGSELNNRQKEYFMLPSQAIKKLMTVGGFELDFVYLHPNYGIFQMEAKTCSVRTPSELENFLEITRGPMEQQRQKLKMLFTIFCEMLGANATVHESFYQFFAPPLMYLILNKEIASVFQPKSRYYADRAIIVDDQQRAHDELTAYIANSNIRNLFGNEYILRFVTFLSGYRPDFFISPVLCALEVYQNIYRHEITEVNYYSRNKSKKIQIIAVNLSEFLKSLNLVKNTPFNNGKGQSIYLTDDQAKSVGKFDSHGNFIPIKQLIFGPPGSGKSLIGLIKLFILGQIESRKKQNIACRTQRFHAEKLKKYVEENKLSFCREVEFYRNGNAHTFEMHNQDFLFFHELPVFCSIENFKPDQIITIIMPGRLDDYHSQSLSITDREYMRSHYEITEVRNIFRSTKQIQNYMSNHQLSRFHEKTAFVSGHNFGGVKIESYTLYKCDDLRLAVTKRLLNLLEIEKCEEHEIGFYFDEQIHDYRLDARFDDYPDLCYITRANFAQSMEYPLMILVEPDNEALYLLSSCAMCHLIIFRTSIEHDE